ncbi:DedA family protein [Deinococcus rubellus]|uniref:VTT domain-containing protein n=1 Tax=Deinococcus rubellus TaxID=1889240 RepID=A0ABY5YJW2_9DEIO|nr:VTT domain-containing protein [Deinococcus rubellus]UWX64981.1 VTT domain-containing protein [Deinococcus rubellus]
MLAWLDSLNPFWLHLSSFALMFLEGMGIPGIPGFLPMLALSESIHAAQTTLWEALLSGTLGNWLGSLMGYRLAASLLTCLPQSWQRLARSKRTARLMQRYGGLLVVVSRTIGSLRTPVTLYAGASGYAWPAYLGWSALGAALHVGIWQTLIWRFGPQILEQFGQLQGQALPYLIGAAVIAAALAWWRWKRRGPLEEEVLEG